LNSRSPLSETKSTSSSLSALSDSLNSSEGGDVVHSNEELKNLLAPPTSAGSQASSGSHSGSGTEDKSDKADLIYVMRTVPPDIASSKQLKQTHPVTYEPARTAQIRVWMSWSKLK
ncbi:hypothetical protein ATANTOWER_005198, partial [Ataeniobius toweri]|nr:hypothetical protein [Ataeniobius toweri]